MNKQKEDQLAALLEGAKTEVVEIEKIETQTYGFRDKFDSENNDKDKELLESVRVNGIMHPPIIIDSGDGRYVAIAGHRRISANRSLEITTVEAKVIPEGKLTEEQIIEICIQENDTSKPYNDVEKCRFLKKSKDDTGFSDDKTAQKYGKRLGITSGVAVNKRVKVAKTIIDTNDSPAIKEAMLKGEVPFAVVSDHLATIDDPESRNEFFVKVVKPLNPVRDDVKTVKLILNELSVQFDDESLAVTIRRDEVKKLIDDAEENKKTHGKKAIESLINDLKDLKKDSHAELKSSLEKQVQTIHEDTKISVTPNIESNSVKVKFEITDENFAEMVKHVNDLLSKDGKIHSMLSEISLAGKRS